MVCKGTHKDMAHGESSVAGCENFLHHLGCGVFFSRLIAELCKNYRDHLNAACTRDGGGAKEEPVQLDRNQRADPGIIFQHFYYTSFITSFNE